MPHEARKLSRFKLLSINDLRVELSSEGGFAVSTIHDETLSRGGFLCPSFDTEATARVAPDLRGIAQRPARNPAA